METGPGNRVKCVSMNGSHLRNGEPWKPTLIWRGEEDGGVDDR